MSCSDASIPDTRAPLRAATEAAKPDPQAARLATIEGIEGLSIGRLADATGIAKSSVYALFGSKEELQLATINAALDSFITEVVTPAFGATEPGRPNPALLLASPPCSATSDPLDERPCKTL